MSMTLRRKIFFNRVKKQKFHLLALLPFLAYLFIFRYYPMYGVTIAFRNFSFRRGIMGSEWVGLRYFEMFFRSPSFNRVMVNTLAMSTLSLIFVTTLSITLAIMICEMRNLIYKRVIQTISYLPHFISWVVVAGMAMTLFSIDGGPINNVLMALGLTDSPVHFLDASMIWGTITGLNVWKSIGWGSIIYIASITSIDQGLYEAAIIDGAGKFKQIRYITLPSILPTIVILLIFNLGYILNAGFEQQFFLRNPRNFQRIEVIDTYIFRYGLQMAMYSYAAAVGLVKSVVGLILVIFANMFSRRVLKMGLF
ncbi:MAG: ABC transporter permease subunit [Defluviitaleaceae bacterium]|nr:ABC transporter permease subunit [Defluviitaleaceae bacterium]